jgi:hypothetical protein
MNPTPETRGSKIVMILFCYVLITIQFTHAQCIASGPNSPASATNVPFTGSDWPFANPTNIFANDGARSTSTALVDLLSSQTDYLQATDFGFSIPSAASICGIEVNVVKRADRNHLNLSYVTDDTVRLIKNNSLMPTNMADISTKWPTTETNSSYGGTNELWGTTWSPADINNSNFGISFSAKITDLASLLPSAQINYISITVYYLDPSVLPAQSVQFHVVNGGNNTAMLSWKPTGTETTSFMVERSANSTNWEALNSPRQKSTISSLYTYTDAKPLPGKSYYRLKAVAASGVVRYSTVQPFETRANNAIKCYPNPFTSFITVTEVPSGERVSLTDIYGQPLFLSSPVINNAINIDVSDLRPGMYVISAGKKKMKILKR